MKSRDVPGANMKEIVDSKMGAGRWGFGLKMGCKGSRGQPFIIPERGGITIANLNTNIIEEMIFEGKKTLPKRGVMSFGFRRCKVVVI